MNQPFDEELISAYLDDELSPEERRDVERLLAERPEAQRLLEELRGLRESLQSLPAYKLQEDFGAAVLRRAEREMLHPASATTKETTNGEISNETTTVSAEIVPSPAAPLQPTAGPTAPVQPALEVERNWRRPAAWSLLAVAAALLLMFVERNRQDAREAAILASAEKENADAKSAAPGDMRSRSEPNDAVAGKYFRRGDETADRDLLTKDGAALKTDGYGVPAAAAAAKPQAEGSADKSRVAGQPTPTGNQFAAMNYGVPPAAPTVPSNHLTVQNSVATASPPLPTAIVRGAQFAVENRLPEGTTVATGQNPLSQQVLDGAGVGGFAVSAQQQQLGVVDVTPLIRSNDYHRARALVSEYEVARREGRDEREAATELSRRMQNRALEQQTLQRQVPLQAKAGPAADRPVDALAADALATNADRLLVVQCDITPEALERGWAPILNREQITDLTTLYSGTATINGIVQTAPAAGGKLQDAEEEFVYVVADSQQLEATLDALRRQPDYFLNVRVEPAPADARQTAWRYRYSRGDDANHANSYVVKNAPAAIGAAPTPAAPPAMLKKAGEESGERKQTAPANADAIAKTESAASGGRALNEVPKLREAEGLQFGGGNSLAGTAGIAPSSTSTPIPNAAVGQLSSSFDYRQQSVAPLSRSQRLTRADMLGAPAASLAQSAPGRANVAVPTTTPLPGSSPAEVVPGNQATVASTRGAAAATAPSAASTPAPTVVAAPAASDPAKALADNQNEKAKIAAGRPAADEAMPQQAATQPIAPQQTAPQPTAQSDQPVWYGVPPDYHEALFIFRVVNQPTAEPKPAAKPAK